MTQPITRNTDPATSHRAAADLKGRMSLLDQVVQYVADHPGVVRGEMADALGWTQYSASKRLSDAVNRGRVFYGPHRPYHGRQQQTCWPYQVRP